MHKNYAFGITNVEKQEKIYFTRLMHFGNVNNTSFGSMNQIKVF